ncbi:C40 family peptidase [Paenibacillus eucommiae]|uniref:Cell wall-associated NlpC family hydrolase n=1 Tax=Paenibacillus eucommiae TaxID=1355755 RepID=A0ABS4J7R5_9BACL|nr:C40 family peptidase [Paenibacillus eucommiae]MBP1995888.1 cell wall-associated NlpC family hydrolase [Paenibacillus eucommiae]
MRKVFKQAAITAGVVALVMTSACSSQNVQPKGNMESKTAPQKENLIHMQSNSEGTVELTKIGNDEYVSAQKLIEILGYNSKWKSPQKVLQLGDNDANYELSVDSTKASKGGNTIDISKPIVLQGEEAYIPVSALKDLFQEDMSFDVNGGQLRLHPSLKSVSADIGEEKSSQTDRVELKFSDDPADPAKKSGAAASKKTSAALESIPALKNVDNNELIRQAEQYIGVKYEFGTGAYPQSGNFDCSTFTQYIYGKHGIELPRLARQQAQSGVEISRKNLRVGDLLFFYVPGRFKTNQTVGHVGIYMGDMKMIHASPKPKDGVQITNIGKPYWEETFLRAKRVAD